MVLPFARPEIRFSMPGGNEELSYESLMDKTLSFPGSRRRMALPG